jgi:hypothetical protein
LEDVLTEVGGNRAKTTLEQGGGRHGVDVTALSLGLKLLSVGPLLILIV